MPQGGTSETTNTNRLKNDDKKLKTSPTPIKESSSKIICSKTIRKQTILTEQITCIEH